ncbi:DUF47 family protein [soil metagenome]
MAFRLIPRDVRFFDLLSEMGSTLATAAARLDEMIERFDRLDDRVAEIQALEKRGDELDEAINRRLEDAFVTPFDREDIHELTVRLDDAIDVIQAVAEMLVIYDVRRPTDECRRLARILAEQTAELAAVLNRLDSRGEGVGHLAAVHRLEHEADGLSRAAMARLFRDGMEPLEVIKWRDLYREMENAIDSAEDAAEAIERMFHKSH